MDSFFQGVLAGYGIAIPVGAIAILILETGLRLGFQAGFAAGAGAATADFLYALLAALAGQALAQSVQPYAAGLRILSGLAVVALGAWGLWKLWRERSSPAGEAAGSPAPAGAGSALGIYARFVGLTVLNPLTVTYFAALILGGGAGADSSWAGRAWFVLGATLASLSWQSLLAGVGALGHRRLSPSLRRVTGLAGNLIVVGLGIRLWLG
jgi:arginine exporter protein ArgO